MNGEKINGRRVVVEMSEDRGGRKEGRYRDDDRRERRDRGDRDRGDRGDRDRGDRMDRRDRGDRGDRGDRRDRGDRMDRRDRGEERDFNRGPNLKDSCYNCGREGHWFFNKVEWMSKEEKW